MHKVALGRVTQRPRGAMCHATHASHRYRNGRNQRSRSGERSNFP